MPAPLFNARYLILSAPAGGTADFVVNGVFFDETSTFVPANVVVNDRFYDAVGSEYEIAVVNTTSPLNCDVTDVETAGAPIGSGSLYRPGQTALGTPIPTRTANGITEFLQQHMRNISIQDSNRDNELEEFTLIAGDITARKVTLARLPDDPESVRVFLANAGAQFEGQSWTLIGQDIDWTGLDLDGSLIIGDILEVAYT